MKTHGRLISWMWRQQTNNKDSIDLLCIVGEHWNLISVVATLWSGQYWSILVLSLVTMRQKQLSSNKSIAIRLLWNHCRDWLNADKSYSRKSCVDMSNNWHLDREPKEYSRLSEWVPCPHTVHQESKGFPKKRSFANGYCSQLKPEHKEELERKNKQPGKMEVQQNKEKEGLEYQGQYI